MGAEEIDIYKRVNIYDRYKAIVDENESVSRLEHPNKSEVENLIRELGYEVRYYAKEKFYQVSQKEIEAEFLFNIILRYGRVEPVFFAVSTRNDTKIGSVLMRICKQLDMAKGIERPKSLGAATFSSYEDLKVILESLFCLYEDFKREVSFSWSRDNQSQEE